MAEGLGPLSPPLGVKSMMDLGRASPAVGGADAEKVAREFEAAFLAQSVDQMLKTANSETFGGGHAEEMWRSFLANAVANQIADTASTGISAQIRAAIDAYGKGGAS